MNWTAEYVPRPDGQGLTEVSSKKYLEDLLEMSRRGLLAKERTASSSSSTYVKNTSERPVMTEDDDDDVRYYKQYTGQQLL